MLNRDVLPRIPCEGSVGASGDLTPLSYVAATMTGKRRASHGGKMMSSIAALKAATEAAVASLGVALDPARLAVHRAAAASFAPRIDEIRRMRMAAESHEVIVCMHRGVLRPSLNLRKVALGPRTCLIHAGHDSNAVVVARSCPDACATHSGAAFASLNVL